MPGIAGTIYNIFIVSAWLSISDTPVEPVHKSHLWPVILGDDNMNLVVGHVGQQDAGDTVTSPVSLHLPRRIKHCRVDFSSGLTAKLRLHLADSVNPVGHKSVLKEIIYSGDPSPLSKCFHINI